ncbi:MAG TPA: hypothetical protein VFH22_13455 [Rhodocyclaceae bacterium]|nr:hypothetical protein [Rhodocyclaceae bacterium]
MLSLFNRDRDFSHPLADPKELKRTLAELPQKDNFKSLDELAGWLESVLGAEGLAPAQTFDIVRQLDDAAQPFLRHLTHAYLAPSARSPKEEQRLWKLCFTYCEFAARAYQNVIDAFQAASADKARAKLAESLRPQLPLLLCRQAAAMIACTKWRRFHHEPALAGVWSQMGRNFLLAESRKIDVEAVTLYPLSQIVTTPRREYVKAVALEASSLDSLLPVQIEVAEKLVAHFAPLFALSRENRPDNLYWVDAALDQAPQRLARLPVNTPGLRLLGFGEVPASLAAITRLVERGEMPPELSLGAQYTPKLLLSVLRHLALYWTAKPPIRKHQRHAVTSVLKVEHGFDACFDRMRGIEGPVDSDELDFCAPCDAWHVGDVSMGGFGAMVPGAKKDWLRVGALIALQPEGGGNWMVGVVRRFQRGADNVSSVGIQTLARQATCVELAVEGAATRNGMRERALLIDPPETADGVRLVLPAATFDLRESYTTEIDGRRVLLSPIELLEAGGDYQIGRFRLRYAS